MLVREASFRKRQANRDTSYVEDAVYWDERSHDSTVTSTGLVQQIIRMSKIEAKIRKERQADKAVPLNRARDGQATERREQAERKRKKRVADEAARYADRERAVGEAAEALRAEAHQAQRSATELKAQAE